MINRDLLRIKTIQLLFAHISGGATSTAEDLDAEIQQSVLQSYRLYGFLLMLIPEITRYAQNRIELGKHKRFPTPEEANPNTRFADNRLAAYISDSASLYDLLSEAKLSWENYRDTIIKSLYQQTVRSAAYKAYMEASSTDLQAEKTLWRNVLKNVIRHNENLGDLIEDIDLYWIDDGQIILSFVEKTIKYWNPDEPLHADILPMFAEGESTEFASRLMHAVLLGRSANRALIEQNLKNWKIERLSLMDTIILECATSEMLSFPTIPTTVTLNEYINLSKLFSSEKSGAFINGVLEGIVNSLRQDGRLRKATLA